MAVNVGAYEGPNNYAIEVCMSYGLPANSNVSTWAGYGCSLEKNSKFVSSGSLSFSFFVFPRQGPLYTSLAVVGAGVNASSAFLSNVTVQIFLPQPCGRMALPVGSGNVCTDYHPVAPLVGQPYVVSGVGAAGPQVLAVVVSSMSLNFLSFSFNSSSSSFPSKTKAYMRWSGAPSGADPMANDGSCSLSSTSSCNLSFPRKGLVFLYWESDGSLADLQVSILLTQCNQTKHMGRYCNQRVFVASSLTQFQTIDVLPGESTILMRAPARLLSPNATYFTFGVAGFPGDSSLISPDTVHLYGSRYGYPSPVLGEEVTSVLTADNTLVLHVPAPSYLPSEAAPQADMWFLRFDFPAQASYASLSLVWWSGSDCPNDCSQQGRCAALTGACSCFDSASGPLCTPPILSVQWIIVIAIVSFIFATVVIAWIVRCYRQKTAYRTSYEEI